MSLIIFRPLELLIILIVDFPGLKNLSISSVAQKQQELLKQVIEQQFVPKEPPSDFEFLADPPSISALDL